MAEVKRQSKKKDKIDKTMGKRFKLNKPLSKNQFERLLTKASQPVSEWHKPCQEVKETLGSRPSDDCSETHKNQDNLEGKGD